MREKMQVFRNIAARFRCALCLAGIHNACTNTDCECPKCGGFG